MTSRIGYFILVLACLTVSSKAAESEDADLQAAASTSNFQIEGKISPPDPKPKDWYWATQILLDGGKRQGFLKVSLNFGVLCNEDGLS